MSNDPKSPWNHQVLTNPERSLVARIDLEGKPKSLASLIGISASDKPKEYMHRGSLPDRLRDADDGYEWKKTPRDSQGWNFSEIVMFPIVGPCQNNRVLVGSDIYPMGQHGLVRCLTFEPDRSTPNAAAFKVVYEANTPIPNPKAGQPGQPSEFLWPYTVGVGKTYEVAGNQLIAKFSVKNLSDSPMPFEFGWHPAWDILGEESTGQVTIDWETISLAAVQLGAVKRRANRVMYANTGGRIGVVSNMPKSMVWSPPDGKLICMEPVTEWGNKAFQGFPTLEGALQPEEEREYEVRISLSPE